MTPLALPALLLSLACTAPVDTSDTSDTSDTDTGQALLPDPLEWQPCLDVIGKEAKPGEECALMAVPLRRDVEGSVEIEVVVRRVLAQGESRGQVWFLGGGPGLSTRAYTTQVGQLADIAPDLDVYSMGHRGTLASTQLWCSQSTAEACAEGLQSDWGDDAVGFNSVEAALDVIQVIERQGPPQGEVLLHGLSYGGWWANRILQQAPGLVTGVVWDSSSDATPNQDTNVWMARGDLAMQRMLDDCATDPNCRAHLGDDPYGATLAIYDDACGVDRETVQNALYWAMVYPDLRAMVPGVIARLGRCEDGDRQAYDALVDATGDYFDSVRNAPRDWTQVLFNLIRASEMEMGASTEDEVQWVIDNTVGFAGPTARNDRVYFELFNLYDIDSDWAQEMPPFLCLNGDYDYRTPYTTCQGLGERFPGAEYQVVELHNASHSMLNTGRQAPEIVTCASDLMAQFYSAPGVAVDTACVDALPPMDFSDDDLALELIGTTVWPD
jgi:pimeloyl-ACP methyl ester carboxylesterase